MINTNNSTDKKVVLVTGASSGIGRQIALDLSFTDYSVYLQGRDTERLMGTLQEMKNPDLHKVLEWDLLDFDSYDKNLADLPYLDGVVHSAGISSKLTLLPFVKLDNLRKIQDTNLNSIIIILSKLWKLKKFNKNGSIVLLSSASADNGVVGTLAYAVSKGAINSAVKVLASEFAVPKTSGSMPSHPEWLKLRCKRLLLLPWEVRPWRKILLIISLDMVRRKMSVI
jgi:NADP-dependent 3-hydroxy acid dehydrogenase YdfG